MTYNEIITQVANDISLPKGFVDRVYRAYWKAVRDYISVLPLKEDLTDEEFNKLRPNVNIPSLGKLYVTLGKYKNLKKYNKLSEEQKKQNQE